MNKKTALSFEILKGNSCKTLSIEDTSFYSSLMTITGNTLQVISPFDKTPVEFTYTQSGITILNSNNLGITNVSPEFYQDLPDGIYTAKISICPYELFWFEKTWMRTCKIECKWHQAFLKLALNDCSKCFDESIDTKLNTAWAFIQGSIANGEDDNFGGALGAYKVANKILDDILNCHCK